MADWSTLLNTYIGMMKGGFPNIGGTNPATIGANPTVAPMPDPNQTTGYPINTPKVAPTGFDMTKGSMPTYNPMANMNSDQPQPLDMSKLIKVLGVTANAIAPNSIGGRLGAGAVGLVNADEATQEKAFKDAIEMGKLNLLSAHTNMDVQKMQDEINQRKELANFIKTKYPVNARTVTAEGLNPEETKVGPLGVTGLTAPSYSSTVHDLETPLESAYGKNLAPIIGQSMMAGHAPPFDILKPDKPTYDMVNLYGPEGATKVVSVQKGDTFVPEPKWSTVKPEIFKRENLSKDVDTFGVKQVGSRYDTPEGRKEVMDYIATPSGKKEFDKFLKDQKQNITITTPGMGQFGKMDQNLQDQWYEQYQNTNKVPPFAFRDAESRNAFTKGYAEWLNRKGITATDAYVNKANLDALKGSLTLQTKSIGAIGAFTKTMDKQIDRVEKIGKDIVSRVGIRALDYPIRELNMRFKGSGYEKVLEAYTVEISNEIAKISTGSQASIRELSESAQNRWAKIHDPNLSMGELSKILKETKTMGKLREDAVNEEIKNIKSQMSGKVSPSTNRPLPRF